MTENQLCENQQAKCDVSLSVLIGLSIVTEQTLMKWYLNTVNHNTILNNMVD